VREKEAMALAAGMAMAAPAAAALQHNIKGTQNGFAYAPASVRVSVRATNASVSAVSYGRFGSSGGAGVLERPGLDQSGTDSTPRTSEGGEMGASKQQVRFGGGERFRVILLDDVRHTESQVTKVLPRAVPQVTAEDARRCFFESRENGLSIVTVAVKEHAEFYAQMMARGGLRSTIEPDQSTL